MKAQKVNSSFTVPGYSGGKLNWFNHLSDRTFPRLTLVFALIVVAILLGILVVLGIDAWPAIQKFGIVFLGDTTWDPVKGHFGALPAIFGTLATSFIGLIIAIPISLGAAVFLVELAPLWMRSSASFLIEILAAIPSVIIGLWGIFVLVPIVRRPIESWLGEFVQIRPFHRT